MSATKTDNHNPRAKLDLRRYMLRKYHSDGEPIRVMDCCQGSGVLWGQLKREYKITSYFGIDKKFKPGRLQMDSVRILAQPGWRENVVDVDTYGSPWKHWLAMLPNLSRPTTVFLTIGTGGGPNVHLCREELTMIGCTMPMIFKMSGAITHNLADLCVMHSLAGSRQYGWKIIEAIEALSDGNARYIAVRLEKAA